MTLIETKSFRRTDGYAPFRPQKHEEIVEDLKVEPDDMKLRRYKSNCLIHVTRMERTGWQKIMLNYRSNGRRRLGRPLKRLLEEAEAGLSRTKWWRIIIIIIIIIILKHLSSNCNNEWLSHWIIKHKTKSDRRVSKFSAKADILLFDRSFLASSFDRSFSGHCTRT
jgi:hypothetical protein